MKTARKIIALLLTCVLFGSTMAWAANAVSQEEEVKRLLEEAIEKASDPNYGKEEISPVEVKMTEEKLAAIYDPANYEGNKFEAGSVVVGLIEDVTITEGYEELFPELGIVSISRVLGKMYDKGLIKSQFVKIILTEQTHESVIKAIELLKNNQNVLFAEPDYYLEEAAGAGDNPLGEPQENLPGDMNRNGYLQNDDLIVVARSIVGLIKLEPVDATRADVNGDGEVNNADLIYIARHVVGLN